MTEKCKMIIYYFLNFIASSCSGERKYVGEELVNKYVYAAYMKADWHVRHVLGWQMRNTLQLIMCLKKIGVSYSLIERVNLILYQRKKKSLFFFFAGFEQFI